MIIVIPMNGKGQRFKDAGYAVPKPLLPFQGKPLIQWVIGCMPKDSFLLFVLRKDLVEPMRKEMKGMFGRVVLEKETSGPTETLLQPDVLDYIDCAEELLIADCDSYFKKPSELTYALAEYRLKNAQGGVTVRQTRDKACSFAKINVEGDVVETREKDPFTDWSTTGPYWFRTGERFVTYARRSLEKGHPSISPIYNEVIAAGGRVASYPVETFIHLGTPEAYEKYNRSPRV